jgi:hypothetical protein
MRKIPLRGLPVILLLVVALAVAVYPALMLAEEEEAPMLCWGIATIDGIAAEEGIVVEIYLGDDTTPTANTTVSTYGGVDPPGTYGAVVVKAGSSRYGTNLTYKVNGIVASTEKVMQPCDLTRDPILEDPVFGECNQLVNLAAIGSGSQSHTWSFLRAGFVPRHLPDTFYGQVKLDNLSDVPEQVQGVYWFDDGVGVWKFWSPDTGYGPVPGTTLKYLGGGHAFDYMIVVSAPCKWVIPLQ